MSAFAAIFLSPLLYGIINRTKAFYAGRQGYPLLQLYYDIFKLFQKGVTLSQTTTQLFRLGPLMSFSALILAASLAPLGGGSSLFNFSGDLILFFYLLGLAKFFIVLSALDTGSAFEGMGASREVQFSSFVEPVFFLSLAGLAHATHQFSLTAIYSRITPTLWVWSGGGLILILVALFIVFLAENSRIPFDDPNTHLELTMIHEVMILDHSGPDLAFLEWSAAIKLWILGSLLAGLMIPFRSGDPWLDSLACIAGLFALSILVGAIECSMARMSLLRVPQMLIGASILACAAIFTLLIGEIL